MTIYAATAAAIVGVLIVGVVVWWLETERRRQEHERFRIMERASRDPGCQAWSAWMAYHRTHGAQVFGVQWEQRALDEGLRRLSNHTYDPRVDYPERYSGKHGFPI